MPRAWIVCESATRMRREASREYAVSVSMWCRNLGARALLLWFEIHPQLFSGHGRDFPFRRFLEPQD